MNILNKKFGASLRYRDIFSHESLLFRNKSFESIFHGFSSVLFDSRSSRTYYSITFKSNQAVSS